MEKKLKSYRLNILFFFLIISIATLFRVYNLSHVPPSPSLDEASIGYNAYSILRTGSDEYGYRFPLLLRAYDDWRPALYVYFVVPFVYLFGLNSVAVRLPSVLLSIASVVVTYFLVRDLFGERGTTQNPSTRFAARRASSGLNNAEVVALLSSFLLAISPWHIYISRLGHEVNLGLTFVLFAILFFVNYIHTSKQIELFISLLFFSLSLYSYQSQKVIVPVLLLTIVILFFKRLLKDKKTFVLSTILFIFISLPILIVSLAPDALIRFKATSAFTSENPIYQSNLLKFSDAKLKGDLLGQIIYNRRIANFEMFDLNYISHFNPRWLFQNSGSEQHKVPHFGLLYLWEFPFILIGVIVLLFGKIDTRIKIFLFVWFLSSPLPSAITTGAPHAMRSYTFLPTWQIFSAVGFLCVFRLLKSASVQKAAIALFVLVITTSLLNLYKNYFYIFPKTQSISFQYALAQSVSFVLGHESLYNKIIFSNQDNLYQSYMFFLFYSRYDPVIYQKQGGTKSGGFARNHKFGKYEFRPIDWGKEQKFKRELYIGNPNDFPREKEGIFSGYYLDRKEGTRIVSGTL